MSTRNTMRFVTPIFMLLTSSVKTTTAYQTKTPVHKAANRLILILIVFFAMSGNVFAQTATTDDSDDIDNLGWTFGLGIAHFSLDQEAASKESIGDTAFSFDLNASYHFAPRFAVSAGLGFLQLDDNAKFTEQVLVTDIFGSDVETATSEAKGIYYYGELLYIATSASSPVQFKAGVGFGSIAGADRSIENCSDCTEIDIDLAGGPYATASIYRGFSDNKYNIGLSGNQFFSGDIKNTAALWFEYIYQY